MRLCLMNEAGSMQNDSEPRDFPGKVSSVLSQASKPGEARAKPGKAMNKTETLNFPGSSGFCRISPGYKQTRENIEKPIKTRKTQTWHCSGFFRVFPGCKRTRKKPGKTHKTQKNPDSWFFRVIPGYSGLFRVSPGDHGYPNVGPPMCSYDVTPCPTIDRPSGWRARQPHLSKRRPSVRSSAGSTTTAVPSAPRSPEAACRKSASSM